MLADIALQTVGADRRVMIPTEEWPIERDNLLANGGKWWIGYHSLASVGGRSRRYCDGGISMEIGEQRFEGLWEGELRNPYLLACDPELPYDHYWNSHDEESLAEISGWELPHFYRKAPDLPLVSIDINAAYLSIFKHFSTRVEYRPESGTWGGVGEPFQDLEELRKQKVLYSTIWSNSWRRKHPRYWHDGETVEQKRVSPTYNPQAARLLSDYFMAIAQEVISVFDAIGALCDAFIVREEQSEDVLEFLKMRWGLDAKVERRWEPGQEWLWPSLQHPQGRIRELPDMVRAHLAWKIGNEKMSTLPAFVLIPGQAVDQWSEPTEPPFVAEAWEKKAGMVVGVIIARPLPNREARRQIEPKYDAPFQLGRRQIVEALPESAHMVFDIERGPPGEWKIHLEAARTALGQR